MQAQALHTIYINSYCIFRVDESISLSYLFKVDIKKTKKN